MRCLQYVDWSLNYVTHTNAQSERLDYFDLIVKMFAIPENFEDTGKENLVIGLQLYILKGVKNDFIVHKKDAICPPSHQMWKTSFLFSVIITLSWFIKYLPQSYFQRV